MTSPILGNRARASIKERLDLLESQFINLKGSLLAELKNHISAENGMEVESAAGTNNIEDYNTMEIFNDNNKTEKMTANKNDNNNDNHDNNSYVNGNDDYGYDSEEDNKDENK